MQLKKWFQISRINVFLILPHFLTFDRFLVLNISTLSGWSKSQVTIQAPLSLSQIHPHLPLPPFPSIRLQHHNPQATVISSTYCYPCVPRHGGLVDNTKFQTHQQILEKIRQIYQCKRDTSAGTKLTRQHSNNLGENKTGCVHHVFP